MLLTFAANYWWSPRDLCGTRILQFGLSPSHVLQAMFCLCAPLLSGSVPVIPHPRATAATASTALDAIRRGFCDEGMSVPSYLIEWSRDRGALQVLSGKIVATGGARLGDRVKEALRGAGVHLETLYGTTEAGWLGRAPEEFDWIQFRALCRPLLEPRMVEGVQMFELVLRASAAWRPAISNRPNGDIATGDLFIRHPVKETYCWQARVDDLISLSNGLNVVSAPIESKLTSTPGVQHAVLFGAGRPTLGALIELVAGANEQQVRSQLEDLVNTMDSPAFSRIRHLIFVDNALPLSSKRTVLRALALQHNADRIEEVYASAVSPHDLLL